MSLTWQQAHNISIVRYLSMHGIFPVYSSSAGKEYHYHSPIRSNDETPSFHLNVIKNKWHDKGTGKGGDSIDLVAEHKNMTRSQSCHWLSQSGLYSGDYLAEFPPIQQGYYWSTKRRQHNNTTTKPINPNSEFAQLEADTSFIIENIQAIQHPILLQYIDYRRLNKDIASKYGMIEMNYQIFGLPEVSYFALAWKNDSGGVEYNSRNGIKSFKGCLGIKDITTINLKPNKKLAIFESMLDFWAYLSYYKLADYQNSAIILNSLSMRSKVLDLVALYQPSGVYLFLDNDIEGSKATESLTTDLQNIAIYDKSSLYENFKDFNEMVMETSTTDRKSIQ